MVAAVAAGVVLSDAGTAPSDDPAAPSPRELCLPAAARHADHDRLRLRARDLCGVGGGLPEARGPAAR